MTNSLRRLMRPILLILVASSFAACHFHHHGFGRCAPIRHCR